MAKVQPLGQLDPEDLENNLDNNLQLVWARFSNFYLNIDENRAVLTAFRDEKLCSKSCT